MSEPPIRKTIRPPYNKPQDAVSGLIEAFRSADVDRMVENKDFEMDCRLFWQDLGLPVSDAQLAESVKAFEINFRKEMEDGIPDYRPVSFSFVSQANLREDMVIVTVLGETTDQQSVRLKLAVMQTEHGWKVVRAPGYDHL